MVLHIIPRCVGRFSLLATFFLRRVTAAGFEQFGLFPQLHRRRSGRYQGDMKHRSAKRRRCTECRKWFQPAPSARDTQKTCSEPCRARRRCKQAQRRRWEHVQQARVDERERQRDCRRCRRGQVSAQASGSPTRPTSTPMPTSTPASTPPPEPAVTPPAPPCHAPASVCNHRDLQGKLFEIVDREMARSRATLERRIGRILGGSARLGGTSKGGGHAPSRAGLGP